MKAKTIEEVNFYRLENIKDIEAGENITIDKQNRNYPRISANPSDSGGGAWGEITGNIEDQSDLVNYIAENGGSVELGEGLHFDNDGKVALGIDTINFTGQSNSIALGNFSEDFSNSTVIGLNETSISLGFNRNEAVSRISLEENRLSIFEDSINGVAGLNFSDGDILFGEFPSIDAPYVRIGLMINDTDGFRIVDDKNYKGITYELDYSANFTDRSLVDKAYVDSVAGGDSVTWTTIEGKPAFVAEGADAVAARTALGLGTAATTDSTAYATVAQGSLADTAVQPSDAVDVAEAGKVVKYSNIGAVNTVEPQFPENAVNLAYLNSSLANKVDVLPDMGLSEENFTTEEKLKLAGVEDPKFKGQYLSIAELLSAGNGEVGGYAYVDNGVTVDMYIWDNTNEQWDIVVGESTVETPSSIKSKYESNPDTNAFTDVLKAKLEAFTANFTSALKIAYDNAVSWISANGTNILNHISNTSNPHNVTAAQLGIVGVENIGKAWIPDYSNMETTNRITSSGGSWTSDRTGFIYVLSRGYNSNIYNTQVAFINDKEVGRVWVEAPSGSGTARSGSFANIYPVKTGDVIKLYGNLEVKCLFIPGIWV